MDDASRTDLWGADPDLLDVRRRMEAVDAEIDAAQASMASAERYLVPGDDIWDDDTSDGDAPWTDAQVVIHDLDGEPYGEPLDDPVYDGRGDEAAASRMARWGQQSVAGAAMLGFGRGLEKVLHQPEPSEIIFEVDDDNDDPERPVRLVLVPGHPERSVAYVRRWLLRRRAAGDAYGAPDANGLGGTAETDAN